MHALATPSLIARLTETWFHRPSTPTRVVMDLTRRCNLRCEMCHTWQVTPGHELTPAEVRAILTQMPKLCWLDVTGGEIFLRRDATELLDAVLDAAPALRMLHFPTNGWFTARTVEAVRRVRERRPELSLIVTVSLDGPRDVHDRIRGRAGSYDRALETLRALRAIDGVGVYVGTTVTPSNADHITALGDALREAIPGFTAAEWHWNWLQISSHFFDNADLAALPSVKSERLVVTHLQRRGAPRSLVELMELVFLVNLESYLKGEPTGVPCQSLRSACFISPEGDLYPCHVYDRPLGNLRTRPVRDLWNDPATLAARADIERLACGGCFTPCEAYPALAGAPVQAAVQTLRRGLRMLTDRNPLSEKPT